MVSCNPTFPLTSDSPGALRSGHGLRQGGSGQLPKELRMMTRTWRHFSAPLVIVFLWLVFLHQSLGLLHSVVHGRGAATAVATQLQSSALQSAHDSQVGAGQWFGDHEEGDAHCRLLDQSSHCDALASLPLQKLPLLVTPFVFSVLPGLALARWHAPFQARGPPPVR